MIELSGEYHDEVNRLIEENERIRGLLAEKVISQTMLTGIIPDNGGMTVGLEGGACAIMADVFGEQLFTSQAENYIELSFESGKYPDLGQIVVTVKRETGKTPHQLRAVAENEREILRKALTTIREESHDIGACECAADALIDSRK